MERHHLTQPNGRDNTGVASGPNSVSAILIDHPERGSTKNFVVVHQAGTHYRRRGSSRLTPPPIEDVSRGAP